jgi:hypothetical protein
MNKKGKHEELVYIYISATFALYEKRDQTTIWFLISAIFFPKHFF